MNRKALIVDDEELVRNYVRRALAGRGWAVTEAANGAEALRLAVPGAFDAMVCDLKMPDLRGEEVIKRARQACPAMKIVAITGSVSDIKAPLAPGVQADGFLIKPFGIDEIRDLLEKLTRI
ncbi:MAG TPA: response regulator [Elusimicrobia bacterium]|nr:MAG: hypothetical protein A2X29_12635 [Elusimicrobia bacterium GWA2_64_40]OGR64524.1 MAG: hypothetical protein A2X30_00375 [Elusimicrobia bacterium GWB2_63_16]HAN04238.1 response regulator [Elusimicrobiota bacterium]HAU90629.1 response regulator [Elusimicrobiota bacterium]